jgi:hypothetical protein
MKRYCYKTVIFVFSMILAMSLNSALAHASIKIDAGKLLNTIIKEVEKGDTKKETPQSAPQPVPEATPPPATPTAPTAAPDYKSLNINNLIEITVTGENVNLRATPSMKGKVVARATTNGYDTEGIYGIFIAEASPIVDNSDKSKWYKILFINYYWGGLRQAQKSSNFNFSDLYVNAKFVTTDPLSVFDRDELEWLKQGRPVRFNVGDGIEKLKKDAAIKNSGSAGTYRITPTTSPLTLYKQPQLDAQTFVLPSGSRIVDPDDWGSYASGSVFKPTPLGYYINMEDEHWIAIVDGNNQQVIGWTNQWYWRTMLNEPSEELNEFN